MDERGVGASSAWQPASLSGRRKSPDGHPNAEDSSVLATRVLALSVVRKVPGCMVEDSETVAEVRPRPRFSVHVMSVGLRRLPPVMAQLGHDVAEYRGVDYLAADRGPPVPAMG